MKHVFSSLIVSLKYPSTTSLEKDFVSPFYPLLILQYNILHMTDITAKKALQFSFAQQNTGSVMVAWRYLMSFKSKFFLILEGPTYLEGRQILAKKRTKTIPKNLMTFPILTS